MTVEETIGSKLSGYPTLLIGNINVESCMVAEVDTLAIIKAIATSETAFDFEWKTRDCWNGEKFAIILKSFVETEREIDKDLILENTVPNGIWLEQIHKMDDIICDEDSTPWERTKALAKIYDYRRHLTYVPMTEEIKEILFGVGDD